MANPWEKIELSDYENHMKLDSVWQLQALSKMMRSQLSACSASTVMILGVAGGNGLDHIDPRKIERVYGVDVNGAYLEECVRRYPKLSQVFSPIRADLQAADTALPKAELVVANLIVEYIGYEHFKRALQQVAPLYVTCAIQINRESGFVSDSPYLRVFDGLESIHFEVSEEGLTQAMGEIGYKRVKRAEAPLPNGKELVRLDYQK